MTQPLRPIPGPAYSLVNKAMPPRAIEIRKLLVACCMRLIQEPFFFKCGKSALQKHVLQRRSNDYVGFATQQHHTPFLLFDGIEMTAFFRSFIARRWQYPALWEVDVSLSCEWSFEKGLERWVHGLINGGPLTNLLFAGTKKKHEEPQLRCPVYCPRFLVPRRFRNVAKSDSQLYNCLSTCSSVWTARSSLPSNFRKNSCRRFL